MSTEPTELAPGSEPPQEENPAPEQNLDVAPQDELEKTESPPEKKELSPEQKTIERLQRRVEKLNGKVGATARENELLRQTQQPKGDDDQTPKDDIEARAEAKAKEIIRDRTLNEKAADTLKAGKKIEGFDEALKTLREEIDFADQNRRITPFFEALLDSDNPAKLIQYLGQNPEEASEFDGLSPAQIGRRLAKLENKLEQDGKAKTSKAPPPIEAIKASDGAATGDLSKLSMDDYIKKREKQGAVWSKWRR